MVSRRDRIRWAMELCILPVPPESRRELYIARRRRVWANRFSWFAIALLMALHLAINLAAATGGIR